MTKSVSLVDPSPGPRHQLFYCPTRRGMIFDMVPVLERRVDDLSAASAALGAVTAAGLLLRRMHREFESTGQFTVPTTVAVYTCYVGHAAATALAARGQVGALRLRSGLALGLGGVLVVGGAGLCVAGMRRFAGPRQISGTDVGGLVTGGVYRYTRNPQYVGYVGVLAGVGLARRSAAALGLASTAALVFRWWVPVEERHLEREFADDYRRYRRHVPRWLGPLAG